MAAMTEIGNGPAGPPVATDNHSVTNWKEFIVKEAKRQSIGEPTDAHINSAGSEKNRWLTTQHSDQYALIFFRNVEFFSEPTLLKRDTHISLFEIWWTQCYITIRFG